jgi:hypothetical protein
MDELGVKVAKLYDIANLLLRRRHWSVCNGLDFVCRDIHFTITHIVAQVLHVFKTEETFLKTPLQALIFETLKCKTLVLKVLPKGLTVDTYVVEVSRREVV